jgi:hypothetical protein
MKTKRRLPVRSRPSAKGLTLIELLVGVAVSALVIIALLGLYMAGQRYFFNTSAKADAIEEVRAPMARIARDIREAAQVSQSTVSVGGTDYSTDAACLVLDLPALDVTGMIIPGTEDTVIYSVDAYGRLHRIVVANGPGRTNADDVLADDVIGFALAYFKEDGTTPATAFADTFIVTVSLAGARPAIQRQSQPYVETLNTRVKLRNKTLA